MTPSLSFKNTQYLVLRITLRVIVERVILIALYKTHSKFYGNKSKESKFSVSGSWIKIFALCKR